MAQKNKAKPAFWRQMFQLTDEGRVKNLDLLYGLFLALAILFVSFLIGNRVTIWFEGWFGSLSRQWLNVLDTAVPTLFSAGLAVLLFVIIPKKRVVLIAHWIAWGLAAALVVALLFIYDRDTLDVLFWPFFCIFLVPASAGAAAATLLYVRWKKKHPAPVLEEEEEEENGENGENGKQTVE